MQKSNYQLFLSSVKNANWKLILSTFQSSVIWSFRFRTIFPCKLSIPTRHIYWQNKVEFVIPFYNKMSLCNSSRNSIMFDECVTHPQTKPLSYAGDRRDKVPDRVSPYPYDIPMSWCCSNGTSAGKHLFRMRVKFQAVKSASRLEYSSDMLPARFSSVKKREEEIVAF